MSNKLDQLIQDGKLTPYLYQQVKRRLVGLPGPQQEELLKEAVAMSGIGVNSEEDHKIFFYIARHSRSIAKKLAKRGLTLTELSNVSNIMFNNRNRFPINTIFNFYKAAEHALNKIQIPIKKTAYPQGDGFGFVENSHDVQKWVQAMREIYATAQQPGQSLSKAFQAVTSDWDKMERKDFKNWMSFYEENAQNKYKTAAPEYYSAAPGVMIPMDHLRAKLPAGPDMSQFDQAAADKLQHQQRQEAEAKKKEEIKKKFKAIISRLNSAERLATDPEFQKDLQQCLDIGVPKWLEELQRVKRLIQLAPMRSSSSLILEDIIVRQANILAKHGHPKAAKEMRKLAQDAPPGGGPPMDPAGAPPGAPPMGVMRGPDAGGDGDKAIDELIEGMNLTIDNEEDANHIEDAEDDPLAAITVMAQAAPPPGPVEDPAAIEVEEPVAAEAPAQTPMDNKTDNLFEQALSQVTIHDVIIRLETLANLFRTREIPRQLAIIDLMMDKLNISAFFPSLAEASSKSLESNQYALTRVEDILSKLRGSVETPKHLELELTGKNPPPSKPLPAQIDTEAVRQGLAQQEEADKARKERRKAEENAEATQPAAPPGGTVTNVPEELAQPANVVPGPAVARPPVG